MVVFGFKVFYFLGVYYDNYFFRGIGFVVRIVFIGEFKEWFMGL